jgi:hypothetical protein
MLLKLDSAFEIALGAALVLTAASGALGGADFPRPVGTVVLLVVGVGLVLLGVAIWAGRLGIRQLAVGNAVSAVAGILWLAAVSGFSGAGFTVVAVAVVGLAGLATAQAATLRA